MSNRQRGMSFAEVLMSVAIIGVLIYAVATVSTTGIQATKTNTDRQFAIQKALSMLEELKSLVQVNVGGSITVLDNFNDALLFRDRLTTIGALTDPADEGISGNIAHDPAGTRWVYSRQIAVGPLADPNNPGLIISSTDVRLIRVRVYKNTFTGGVLTSRRLLAEVASVVRTLAVSFPTTQVYDVYCVAVENVPGWWVNMGSLVPFVQAAIDDLENRHPGLEFRQRWIRKLSYGRDTQYRPYINATVDTLQPVPWAYYYPGVLPTSYNLVNPAAFGLVNPVTPPAQFYYPPANFNGMMQQEPVGGVPLMVNTQTPDNPAPYALADGFNHAMRHPDELALYRQRLIATDASGNLAYPGEQPTLRILLEDMYQNPNQYLNALFINLHGELLPFPPVRNYSNPAKKPGFYTAAAAPASPHNGVRVVTHPENLAYDTTVNAAAPVNLRVHSYLTNPLPNPDTAVQIREPDVINTPVAMPIGKEMLSEPISVVISGINWTPGAAADDAVSAITGGVDFDTDNPLNPLDENVMSAPTATDVFVAPLVPAAPRSVRDPYLYVPATPNVDAAAPDRQMYHTREYIAPGTGGRYPAGATVIKLWNSPLVHPCVPVPTDCEIDQHGAWVPGGPYPMAATMSGGLQHNNPLQTRRLYGMEYIPSPLEHFAQVAAQTPFGLHLAGPGDTTKNTARWIIRIPAVALPVDAEVQVETMIGDLNVATLALDPIPGHPAAGYNEPPNRSNTYFWRGTTLWLFGPAGGAGGGGNLPITERYQIVGDPRHSPYADVKKPHNNNGVWPAANVNTQYGMGYNRYFDDFENLVPPPALPAAPTTVMNEAAAHQISRLGGPFAIGAATDRLHISINGGATFTANLINGGARTLAQVVADMTAVVTANGGTVDAFNGRIRIRSNSTGSTSSVRIVGPGLADDASQVLGFRHTTHRPSWPGWNYLIGATAYGVRNDAGAGNANWTSSGGGIELDMPRIYQIHRSGLMFSNSLYTTMTGWPYYYIGMGNEIGYDQANGFPESVPMSRRPFEGTDVAQYFEQAILPGGANESVKYIAEANFATAGAATWFGMHWLGELYPDDRYSFAGADNDWREVGNLSVPDPTAGEAANLANRFRRIRRDDLPMNDVANLMHTPGTTFMPTTRRTHEQGVPTFFWVNAGGTSVDVAGVCSNCATCPATCQAQANISTGGTEINTTYSFPLDSPIAANRPFNTNLAPPATDGLGQNVYSPRLDVTELMEFYNNTINATYPHSSVLLSLREGATQRATFIVENGLSPTGDAGTDFIARWSFLTLIQGFLESGLFGNDDPPAPTQLPRLRITNPNPNTNLTNPMNINVTWAIEYRRWDGRRYTNSAGYAGAFTETAALSYFPMYSDDNGLTWKYIRDGSPAQPGVRMPSTDPRYPNVVVSGVTTVAWDVSALPAQAYIIRVEGYRDLFPLHYSYHQYQAFLVR